MTTDLFFKTHPVFTHAEFAQSRGAGRSLRTVDSLLRKHVASGRIARVRRGLYVVPTAGGSAEAADPFLLATKAAPDAAVSHHAALQFHGCAYSLWTRVTFLTTSATRGFRFGPVEYVPVRAPDPVAGLPDMGGGIQRLQSAGGEARVCTLERASVDVLHAPEYGGGWEEIFRSLAMVPFFNLEAVLSHTLALGSSLTVARVGYFLSANRDRLFVEDSHIARLAAHAPKQARYLDASRESGQLVHPWNLIVPAWVAEG
jgi:predicted transcriptional regulator of viral defense system